MDTDRNKEAYDIEASLVIIGGGGAGLAAAVAAAEKGVDVIVLEKRRVSGGSSAMAGGPFGVESPAQRRQAIDARRDDLFRIAMSWAHLKVNARIVRAFIDKSGDTIRWLEDKGLYFNCNSFVPDQVPCWHVSKGGGAEIMEVLADECKRLEVEVYLRTQAKKILTGPEGNVIGVAAEREGEEFTVTTKNVIIASGGYGGNKELLKKYCAEYHDKMRCNGVANMGDGLVMATEIGADTEGLGILMLAGPSVAHSILFSVGAEPNVRTMRLVDAIREPYTIWVNNKGKRFIDETVGFIHYESSKAVARQPHSLCYTLFDTRMVKMINEHGLERNRRRGIGQGAIVNTPLSSSGGLIKMKPISELPAGLEGVLKVQAEKGEARVSDNWDDIAEWIGVDHGVLMATIDEYNSACDVGHDPVFAKDRRYLSPLRTPPYYAVKCSTDYNCTLGGIKINEHMEVLDKKDNPIPGLYAAGVDAGGWMSDVYCAVTSGAAFGFALNSGRIAGENAAQYVQ